MRGDVTTNSVESFFALVKRGVRGTYHHISKKHVARYCDEFAFRWNYRKKKITTAMQEIVRLADGKRLTYKELVS